ncbi:hypothetical protein K450DRAFT_254127 [Umbelopsis ramanniana AG]|uniref:Uncharacterized protein n=1 Tax=Umbelopsis ramanniana AG TaxID=1314678 RepID=A0AAD5HAF4_UMBRA|nr:uncharacterized protein K450DRAFT_254127 [Umbelopsis ramanniana AG]KAI8577050.1 hypothetical protein K450DRAFT_254127 [Umbelopsis ramanniana AG]
MMFRILNATDKLWTSLDSSRDQIYKNEIAIAYSELTEEDKKKYDALVEGVFKDKFLNPERFKLEQARSEYRCPACQNDAHEQIVVSKSAWAESLVRIVFLLLSFYTAHTFSQGLILPLFVILYGLLFICSPLL